jgi:hypothetical protein
MVIEVKVNVFKEVMTRTSKLRKCEFKFGGKPTTEGQGHWIRVHPVKTRIDG